MAEAITSRLLAHVEGAAGALKRILLVAVAQPDAALADLPLHDTLIRIDSYVDEWHRTFARAGSRLNELTSIYRALALATQLSVGIEVVLHSYAVTERARRQLFPFPHLDRPRMTPAVSLLMIALHNLFWLVRNRRAIARDEGDSNLQVVAADVVLAPLHLIAKSDTIDVGDLIAMTELSRWAVALLCRRAGQATMTPSSPADAGASGGLPTPRPTLATLAVPSGRQENAEVWLAAAVEAFRPEFAACGYGLPRVMVSISPPSRFRLPAILRLRHPFGRLRWHRGGSGSMVAEIPIDTNLTQPLDVLWALKQQLIHAALSALDPEQRRGTSFRKAAFALGMDGRRSVRWTLAGRASAREISERLGPYPRPGKDRPEAVADTLVPSILALGSFSPIARLEGAAEGLSPFAGWSNAWPGLRQLVSAPEAASFRQELVSRLAVRLSAPGAGDRLAAFLEVLTTLEGIPGLNPELWFDFVAGLLIGMLGATREDIDQDPAHWRLWTQEPHGRNLAYLTGRLARVAEDLAARRAEHEYPNLVWRWRDIARLTLVPWLDTHAYLGLCLGHWLEGLLAGSDLVPTLTVGRRVCGFGLAEIVSLWQRSGDIATDRMSLDVDLDPGTAAALQASLAGCRARLAALPAMRALIRESHHFDVHRPALPGHGVTDRPVIATLIRYAEADGAGSQRELSDATAKDTHEQSVQDDGKAIKHAIAYRDRGLSYAAKGEHDRAIQDYNNAIKLNPKDAIAYHNRGLSDAAQGKHDGAIEDYSEAIRLNPKYSEAYINRGVSYAIKGERDLAIEDFSEAIKINANYAIAYRNRGLSYAAKGERDRAIRDFSEAIRLNPTDAVAYHNRGLSYGAKGEQDRAIWDYNEAIKLNPKYAVAYHNRGLSYGAKGEQDRAIWDFNEAIELNPKYAVAYHNRGLSYAAKGEHDRAIQDFNEAIRLDPKDGLAHYNRGRSYEQRGDRERARADYNVARTLEASADDRRGQRLAREGLARLGPAAADHSTS